MMPQDAELLVGQSEHICSDDEASYGTAPLG